MMSSIDLLRENKHNKIICAKRTLSSVWTALRELRAIERTVRNLISLGRCPGKIIQIIISSIYCIGKGCPRYIRHKYSLVVRASFYSDICIVSGHCC